MILILWWVGFSCRVDFGLGIQVGEGVGEGFGFLGVVCYVSLM